VNSVAAIDFQGLITPLSQLDGRTINMGPCLVNDSADVLFELYNMGIKSLYMERLAPSFYLGASPNDPSQLQFNLFKDIPLLPKTFIPNEKDTMVIMFRAGDTIVTKPGWHEAMLAMSFLNNETKKEPPVTQIDTFFLKVKKTLKYFDNFYDVINFDSVYVNPTNGKSLVWKGKNTFHKQILLNERKVRYITQPQISPEFSFSDDISHIELIPKGILQRQFSYLPLDVGIDSAIISHEFVPKPDINADSTDFSEVLVVGTGVKQNLEIKMCNFDFSNDTIYLGNVSPDEKVSIYFIIKNTGNLPIFLNKEEIINSILNKPASELTIVKKIQENLNYLMPDSTDYVSIDFIPKNNSHFLYNYHLITNISERAIYGVPTSEVYKDFYISGNVTAPKFKMASDTIDYGNIVLNRLECPARRDTTARISNIGNANLSIFSVEINPEFPESPFKLFGNSSDIGINSNGEIKVSFEAVSDYVGEITANMIINTNESIPPKQRVVTLRAKTLPPLSGKIMMPDNISAKPGTLVEIPILLNYDGSNPVAFASRFQTDIYYNRSLLEYVGTVSIGMASEGSINKSDSNEEQEKDYISLNFEAPTNNYFSTRDTILKVRFKTYLGDAISTELAIVDPKFSDSRCDNLFNLQISNGAFLTDSVCGIQYKTVRKPVSKLGIKVLESQNYGEKIIECNIPYKEQTEVDLFDNQGNKVRNIVNELLPAGVFQFYLNEEDFNSGLYYIIIKNRFTYSSYSIIIVR